MFTKRRFLKMWIVRGLNGLGTKRFKLSPPPTVCIFFRCLNQHIGPIFFNFDFAMYSVQSDKILLKNVNFMGLKWTRTQKIRIFVTAECFGIFADFKSTFWPYFSKTYSWRAFSIYRKEYVLFQLKIRGASKKFKNQPRPLLKGQCHEIFCFWNQKQKISWHCPFKAKIYQFSSTFLKSISSL
jgi:hypothetical protein